MTLSVELSMYNKGVMGQAGFLIPQNSCTYLHPNVFILMAD